ncbi:kinetochore protein Nuf2 [Brachypodium distachyon]|uniref:Kinetochore protein Nuf2 N-terminal domain-containing protein n=1 Tax=Brachypodium distachyon TaxID=15368 RepID=A0A0Q3JIK0_BRADI|nr:kinetochore protein Nuf2 [Brachypodium distachyon]KQK12108.1 hypothetical protein BRADI_1g01670v3 [Brachypodium distachyon]|eukprot:XP_003562326.1 kinetochore protein Nuf2 [Brachypodium distachyon]
MPSGYSFPTMSPAQIAEALTQYGISPLANLRPEDIAKPQPDLLSAVLSRFIASFVDSPGDDGEDAQLGFKELEALDNPEHHAEGIRALRLYNKSRAFLDSIQVKDFTLADLLHPHPNRVVQLLSALVNFLFYREDKLGLLQPIADQAAHYHERSMELKDKIAQLQKEIGDHELAEQMDEPIVQQLEAEVNGLQLNAQAYNKKQLALRAKAKTITEKREEILSKITQADFELTKHAQENAKLLSKVVQSPQKIQRALEEKKTARAQLKNSEKMAVQNVQEKTATLEIYNKAFEKLAKQFSKIQDLQEQVSAAKTVEKEVKALKAKLNDESASIMSLDAKIVEWQGKVLEAEERLKAKVKERNQIVADENQKLVALRSEIECKLQCLEPREREVEAKIEKASRVCAETDSKRTAGAAEQQKVRAKFDDILQAYKYYMDTMNPFLERLEDMGKKTPQRLAGKGSSDSGPSAVATKTTTRANATSKKLRVRIRT